MLIGFNSQKVEKTKMFETTHYVALVQFSNKKKRLCKIGKGYFQ